MPATPNVINVTVLCWAGGRKGGRPCLRLYKPAFKLIFSSSLDKYESMEEKLGVLQETRRSLDEMRVQRREKLRQQEMEQDMLRRMQMEQKMELLRQQKQEYMLYQKQLQTQRQQTLEQVAKGRNIYNYIRYYVTHILIFRPGIRDCVHTITE